MNTDPMHALEIEAKFVLSENGVDFSLFGGQLPFSSLADLLEQLEIRGSIIEQGYIALSDHQHVVKELGHDLPFAAKEVRLRKVISPTGGGCCFLTAKSEGGLVRDEFEFEIDHVDFDHFWPLTKGRRLRKKRLECQLNGLLFEFDRYYDRDLVVAEVNLPDEKLYHELLAIGKDVTANPSYKNRELCN